MLIYRAQYQWKQAAGTAITRPVRRYYCVFHFCTPVDIVLNGRKIRTQPNAFIFLRPMEERQFHFTQDSQMNWIHACEEFGLLPEKYNVPYGEILYPADGEALSEIFRKMRDEVIGAERFRDEYLEALTHQMFIEISRNMVAQNHERLHTAEKIKLNAVRTEILSEVEKRWTVEEMAQLASLSSSRFYTLYRNAFSISPMQDLILAKIDRAKVLLLLDEDLSVAQLAERLGYKSEQHFISQFRRYTQMTPAAYRRSKR